MKSKSRWTIASVAVLVLGLAFALVAAGLAFGSTTSTVPYAPYTAGPVVREMRYVDPLAAEPIAERPYAPYTAGPVVPELEPYAPYTAGPVVPEVRWAKPTL